MMNHADHLKIVILKKTARKLGRLVQDLRTERTIPFVKMYAYRENWVIAYDTEMRLCDRLFFEVLRQIG